MYNTIMSQAPINKSFSIVDAIEVLCPDSRWVLSGVDYSGLEWLDEIQEKPTEEDLLIETQRLQSEYDLLEYQRLRAAEYPDMAEYLDGIVKGDQDQIDRYIYDCLAVKAKYPKPSV